MLLNIMTHEDPESAMFFQKIIDYDLDEFQVNSLMKLLTITDEYLNNNISISKETFEEFEGMGLTVNDNSFDEETILTSLEKWIINLGIDIKIKYLLLSLKRQRIHENLCNLLIKKIQN